MVKKKQGKKVKQQASLFTFFGKKKKRSSSDDNCNDDETVHDKSARKHIKLSSADNNNDVDTVVNYKSCNAAAEVLKVSNYHVANDDKKVDKKEGAPSQLPERNNIQKVDELVEKPKSNNPAIESSSDTLDTDADNSSGEYDSEEEEFLSVEQGAPPDEEDNKYKGKSPYEILREKNIERNNKRLAALGLLVGNTTTHQQQSDSKKKKRKKASAKKATTASSVPTRRSGRLKKPVVTNSGTELEVQHDNNLVSSSNNAKMMEFEEEEEIFTVSPLIEYQMTSSSTNVEESTSTNDNDKTKEDTTNSSISTLTPTGPRLNPPSGLNAIYSLQFHPQSWESNVNHQNGSSSSLSSWLAGAGKSGLIALWDCSKRNNKNLVQDDEESGGSYINPVLSWKGHSGRWIADARFVPPLISSISSNSISSSSTVPSRLLTAGNDGNVCHWDVTLTSQQGVPKLLEQSTKMLHGSGIFSMDVSIPPSSSTTSSPYIVTGSKDKSLAVTILDRLSNEPMWRSNYHTAKVGSVSFSSSNNNPLIASASDDGCVAIHDARLNSMKGTSSNGTAAVLEDAHVKPHSAVWQPGSDCVFMTAGLDEVIKLWDLRNTSSPVASYHGHVPGNGKRLKRIHRPTFFNNMPSSSSFILSGGECSHSISMFQLGRHMEEEKMGKGGESKLHSVFSRGALPHDVGDIGSLAVHGRDVAVAVEGGEVLLLSPK